MRRTPCFVLLVLTVATADTMAQEPTGTVYEDESQVRFRTSDLMSADVLKGPNYELDPETTLNNGRFVFRIQTQWGILIAHGKPMLALRLREMYAIERARRMNREPQLIGSFLNTLVDSRKGAELLLTDPIGSVLRVPAGIGKGLNNLLRPSNRKSGGEIRRRIAAELDCDPETTNPVLSALLDWIAVRQGAGGIAGKVGLHLVLPGLALIPTTAQFKEKLATQSPAEINARLKNELVELGFDREISRKFVRSSGLTTLQRLMVVEQLKPLTGVSGRHSLLRRAAAVEKTTDAVTVLHELVALNQLHKVGNATAVIDLKYPLVTLHDGQQVVLCTAGYLVFNQPLHRFTTACRAIMKQPTVELQGTVGLSEKASQVLQANGIRRPATATAD